MLNIVPSEYGRGGVETNIIDSFSADSQAGSNRTAQTTYTLLSPITFSPNVLLVAGF